MAKLVLIGCEESGTIREEYRKRGHDAWSCDLKPARDGSKFHIKGCVLKAVKSRKWDQFIVHPDCTYLAVSGIHWNSRISGRDKLTEKAIKFFMQCVRASDDCNIPEFSVENPISIISTAWREPDQIIQPYEFGDDASKNTCLWSRGLPDLQKTKYVYPRWVCADCGVAYYEKVHHARIFGCVKCNGKCLPRWGNQTDSGQNKLSPNENRKRDRSKTYCGIAQAMAIQWGDYDPRNAGIFSF